MGDDPGQASTVFASAVEPPSLDGLLLAIEHDKVSRALFDAPGPQRAFGPYEVQGLLGRGGMGTVFEAFDPRLDRKVAIKVLHPDVARGHTERLVREAKALAKLSHPNVVHVYDVGTAADQTFVSMELVRGMTLEAWQRERRPWRACVEVYLQAGRGLAAAHERGLVHRDFKPGNCILDEDGRARVLDFGLVRSAGTDVVLASDVPSEPSKSPTTQLTSTGAVLGTLAYMAPEQIDGGSVDARADQFSFCAALFEGLYGERPVPGASAGELLLALREGTLREPVTGVSVPRRVRLAVMRGLGHDPDARWPSMDPLLDELQRALRPTWMRWTSVATLAVSIAGVSAALWSSPGPLPCRGARQQLADVWDEDVRDAARSAVLGTELAYAVATWDRVQPMLDQYTDDWVAAHTRACEATAVHREQSAEVLALRMTCLDAARRELEQITTALAGATDVVVRTAVQRLADLPALERCDDIGALRAQLSPPDDPKTAAAVEALRTRLAHAHSLRWATELDEAFAEADAAVTDAETSSYPAILAEALETRAAVYDDMGRMDETASDLRRAYLLAIEHDHRTVEASTAKSLCYVVGTRQAKLDEGRSWCDSATALASRPDMSERTRIEALHNAGQLAQAAGDMDTAATRLQEVVDLMEDGDPTSLRLSAALSNLGHVLSELDRHDDALASLQRALEIRKLRLGPEHPRTADTMASISRALYSVGKLEEALDLSQRALEIEERVLPPDHVDIADTLFSLGITLRNLGRQQEALQAFERARGVYIKNHGEEHPTVATTLLSIAGVQADLGDAEQGYASGLRARDIFVAVLGPDHRKVAATNVNLGANRQNHGKPEQALAHYEQALPALEKIYGREHRQVAAVLHNMAGLLNDEGQHEQALELYQQAVDIWTTTAGADHPNRASGLSNLALVLGDLGRQDERRPLLEEALRIRETTLGAEHPLVAASLLALADVCLFEGDAAQATALAERAMAIYETSEAAADPADLTLARVVVGRALHADPAARQRSWPLLDQARAACDADPGHQPRACRDLDRFERAQ